MTPTRVNAAIWARLLSDTRFRGIKMQQVQCLLLKAIVAQTWVTASFLKLKETTPGATSPASYPALLLPRGQCGTRRDEKRAKRLAENVSISQIAVDFFILFNPWFYLPFYMNCFAK